MILAISIGAGLVLGWIFFGVLAAEVSRVFRVVHPAGLMIGGFVLRMLAAVLVFGLLARFGGFTAVMGGVGGFVVAQIVAVFMKGRAPHPAKKSD